jgi:hypothetical protein
MSFNGKNIHRLVIIITLVHMNISFVETIILTTFLCCYYLLSQKLQQLLYCYIILTRKPTNVEMGNRW